jgi:16S rRNA (adenine1518-N6/adenine1519-N6)-dimethyltransferase
MEKLRPKKSLGQHWLVSERVLAGILDAAEPLGGRLVVEVGPGTGMLTRGLLERGARVIAVEKDEELAARLEAGERLRVVAGDILETNLREFVAEPYAVVANIPYYLSGRLFRYFFEQAPRPGAMVLLVQQEVAERLTAGPGEMSLLGLAAQLHALPELLFEVPPSAFRPAPRVSSAVVRLRLFDEPLAHSPEILQLARHAFAGRRKQLRSSLSAGLRIQASEVEHMLHAAGLESHRRPQELTVEEWGRLATSALERGVLS